VTRHRIVLLALVALASACAAMPGRERKPWDYYAGDGPLRVHGTERSSAGRALFRELRAQPGVGPALRRQGTPDMLEVRKQRFGGTTILLTYTRRGAGAPRVVRIESVRGELVVRAAEPLPAAARSRAVIGEPRTKRKRRATAPSGAPRPAAASAEQELACPIDPDRHDCRALCGGATRYDWCP
jgi:hypothetical protein